MDISNTLTMPQLILTISLFTLLISWLVIFAYLAVRPTPEQHVEQTEYAVITSPVIQTFHITTRTSGMRTTAPQTPIVTVSADPTHEIVLDHPRQ